MKKSRPRRLAVVFSALFLASAACGGSGQPEIVKATVAQDIQRVRELIGQGADVNDRGSGEWTPAIHYTEGNEEILRLLLEAGADPNSPDPTSTVLGAYSLAGKASAVALLLDHGAEIDAQDSLYGNTALHNAAQNGNLEVVELLVEWGADASIANQEGQTPYDAAAAGLTNPERQAVMRYLEPDKNPLPVPVSEDGPGTKVLSVLFSGLVQHDGKRCIAVTLENIAGRTVEEFYGGIRARRTTTKEIVYSWGFSVGIPQNLQPGGTLDTGWCPDESREADVLSLLEDDPGSVDFIFDAQRVVYGDGSEEVFDTL